MSLSTVGGYLPSSTVDPAGFASCAPLSPTGTRPNPAPTSSQMPPTGATAMTTVEARGTGRTEPAAVSRDRLGIAAGAPGAQLTRQVGRDDALGVAETDRAKAPLCDAALPVGSRTAGTKPRATTCTYHCSACGRHFHSLQAFDAHRTGDFASNTPETRRRCLSPFDLLDEHGNVRLVALTETGLCRMYEAPEASVTVWTMAGSLERARERWGA